MTLQERAMPAILERYVVDRLTAKGRSRRSREQQSRIRRYAP